MPLLKTAALTRTRQVFYYEYPSPDDPVLPVGIPRAVIDRAHEAGTRIAVVIASAPVSADRYRALAALLRQGGLEVRSDYVESLSISGFTAMRNAADDLLDALIDGSALVVSWGRSLAPTVVACAYVMSGLDPVEAMEKASLLRPGRMAPDEEGGFIYHFNDYLNLNGGVRQCDGGADSPFCFVLELLSTAVRGEERLSPIMDAVPASRRRIAEPVPARPEDKALIPEEAPRQEDALTPAAVPAGEGALTPAESGIDPVLDAALKELDGNRPRRGKKRRKGALTPSDVPADAGTPSAPLPVTESAPLIHDAIIEEIPGTKSEPAKKRRRERPVPRKVVRPVIPAGGPEHQAPFYRSLQFKLISIISIIIAASLSGMIFVATYFFSRDSRIQVDENSIKLAEVIALKVSSDFESIIKRVRLADVTAARPGQEAVESPLRGDQDVLSAATALRSQDGEGVKLDKFLPNDELMAKLQVTRQAVEAATAMNGKTLVRAFLGELVIHNVSQALSSPVIALAMPEERDAGGRVTSIQICFVSLTNIQKAFETKGGVILAFMVNDQGDIIAHPDVNIVVSGGNYIDLPIVKMMMTGNSLSGKTRYADANGVFNIGSFQKTGIGGCGVITTVEEQRALEGVYDIQRRNIYLMIIVLTVGVMVIYYFGRSITNPVVRLVEATKLIRDGVYQMDIVPTTRDEIGELTSSFIEMGKGLEEREKIKSAFGKFVNKEIAEAAMRGDLALGGERKEVAVLFSDIRKFTSISESLEPEEVVEFLNEYLSRMVGCVNGTHGVVDKFIGDAIMAIWGTPVSHGNDTENAINCALMMRRELIDYNHGRGTDRKPLITIGCGINMGPVLAGQIGSQDRMEYTVIGDTVNLASRVESLNKPFGTDILISQDACDIVKDVYAVERMQRIRVKGKEEPQQIFAVLGRFDDPTRPKSVAELRTILAIEPDIPKLGRDADGGEVKYEILE
jgi:adenylate cyclase